MPPFQPRSVRLNFTDSCSVHGYSYRSTRQNACPFIPTPTSSRAGVLGVSCSAPYVHRKLQGCSNTSRSWIRRWGRNFTRHEWIPIPRRSLVGHLRCRLSLLSNRSHRLTMKQQNKKNLYALYLTATNISSYTVIDHETLRYDGDVAFQDVGNCSPPSPCSCVLLLTQLRRPQWCHCIRLTKSGTAILRILVRTPWWMRRCVCDRRRKRRPLPQHSDIPVPTWFRNPWRSFYAR